MEIPYIEVSAKDATNVNEAFELLATDILLRYREKDKYVFISLSLSLPPPLSSLTAHIDVLFVHEVMMRW